MVAPTIYETLRQVVEIQKSLKEKELKQCRDQQRVFLEKRDYHAELAALAKREAASDISLANLQEKSSVAHLSAVAHYNEQAQAFAPQINQLTAELRELLKREIGLDALEKKDKALLALQEEERANDILHELEILKRMQRASASS
jgi:hypothetical protein